MVKSSGLGREDRDVLAAAEEIRAINTRVKSEFASSLEDHRRMGALIIETKAKLKHGEFSPWCRDDLGFKPAWSNVLSEFARNAHDELAAREWHARNGNAAPNKRRENACDDQTLSVDEGFASTEAKAHEEAVGQPRSLGRVPNAAAVACRATDNRFKNKAKARASNRRKFQRTGNTTR